MMTKHAHAAYAKRPTSDWDKLADRLAKAAFAGRALDDLLTGLDLIRGRRKLP